MNYFKLTKSWISQIFDILRCTKNNSLIIGYTYLFIFLVLPSLPFIQFLSPIVIILWPIAVVQIVIFYHSSQDKKIKFLSLDPKIKKKLVSEALEIFFDLRKIPGLKKKPSTSELIDWLKLLLSDDMPDEILKNADSSKAIPPLYGALLKNEQDVQLLERLAFMSRRESASTK